MQISTLIKAVKQIQASDKRWIPQELRENTFFSDEDIWQFIPSWDAKQCDECGEFALGIPYMSGRQLRSTFPYLEVVDADHINANVHPNCRCVLIREGAEKPREVISKEEAKEAFVNKR